MVCRHLCGALHGAGTEGDDGSVPTVAQPPKAVSPAPPSEPQKAEMGEPGELSDQWQQHPNGAKEGSGGIQATTTGTHAHMNSHMHTYTDVNGCGDTQHILHKNAQNVHITQHYVANMQTSGQPN